jgi:hypothetical protein
MAPKAVASTVATARRLRDLAVTASAWLDGSLSGAKVQAVVASVE